MPSCLALCGIEIDGQWRASRSSLDVAPFLRRSIRSIFRIFLPLAITRSTDLSLQLGHTLYGRPEIIVPKVMIHNNLGIMLDQNFTFAVSHVVLRFKMGSLTSCPGRPTTPTYAVAFSAAIFSPSVHSARFNAVLWSIPLTSRV